MSEKLSEKEKLRRKIYLIKWKKENPDKVKEHAKRSRIKNKDRVFAYQKEWTENNPDKKKASSDKYYIKEKMNIRNKQLLKEFGIDLKEYNRMLMDQDNKCAVCKGGPDASGKTFAVDHDHKTGKVRGLLCRGCNVGMGNLKDDPELLECAAKYIRKHELK